tara:strand:+ start:61 stop:447 length:387 start_codon:yes stop_codon:yes gene_type:complete
MEYANEAAMADYAATVMIIVAISLVLMACVHWLLKRKPSGVDIDIDYTNIPVYHTSMVQKANDMLITASRNGCEPHMLRFLCTVSEPRGQRDLLLSKYVSLPYLEVASTIDMCILYGKFITIKEVYSD